MKQPETDYALSAADVSRIIEMAWEDRTPFEAIKTQFGIGEPDVIKIMRRNVSAGAFRRWRARVSGRKTKHAESPTAGSITTSVEHPQQGKPLTVGFWILPMVPITVETNVDTSPN